MASQTVWLGLAGDMIEPNEQLDNHATKCGGAPLYPGSRPPLSAADVRCRVCGTPLSLVLQVSCGPGCVPLVQPHTCSQLAAVRPQGTQVRIVGASRD